jgi:ferredoxin
MAIKYLAQDQLPAFLASLVAKGRVVAPVNTNGVVQYEVWQPETEVELDVLLAKQSPKEWVFPQCETFLKFTYRTEEPGDGGTGAATSEGADEAAAVAISHETVDVQAQNEAPAQIIFGLRPCDARGFVQMDQVFGGYGGFYFDPLYNARREATTLLAVTCREPRSTCFCTAIGGCPAGHEGVDALFTQVTGGFVVEVLTEKGETALAFNGVNEASDDQVAEANAVKLKASAKVDAPFDVQMVQANLPQNIESDGWHDLSMRCISCGTCTYVCPSCYCFNISDQIVDTQGERYRTWDNCFNPLYTEETSGHNPRAQKSNRFRNRFSHKFWYYPAKYDSLLCSGCGRCIMHCPTRIDIREVLRVMGAPAGEAPTEGVAAPAAGCTAASTEGKEA